MGYTTPILCTLYMHLDVIIIFLILGLFTVHRITLFSMNYWFFTNSSERSRLMCGHWINWKSNRKTNQYINHETIHMKGPIEPKFSNKKSTKCWTLNTVVCTMYMNSTWVHNYHRLHDRNEWPLSTRRPGINSVNIHLIDSFNRLLLLFEWKKVRIRKRCYFIEQIKWNNSWWFW